MKGFLDEEIQDKIEANYKSLTDRLSKMNHDLPTSKSKT